MGESKILSHQTLVIEKFLLGAATAVVPMDGQTPGILGDSFEGPESFRSHHFDVLSGVEPACAGSIAKLFRSIVNPRCRQVMHSVGQSDSDGVLQKGYRDTAPWTD